MVQVLLAMGQDQISNKELVKLLDQHVHMVATN